MDAVPPHVKEHIDLWVIPFQITQKNPKNDNLCLGFSNKLGELYYKPIYDYYKLLKDFVNWSGSYSHWMCHTRTNVFYDKTQNEL